MKALFKYAMIASAVIAAAACNDLMESSKSQFPQGEATILVAAREGVAPDTKSIRLSDGSVWWNPAEEVSVFYGSGSNGGSKFVSQNTDIAETAELSGDIQMSGSTANFWAVYPYDASSSCDGESITTTIPDQQEAVEGNFSGNVFPAMATSESTTLTFYNLCGGLKFFVSRSDIKSLTIKGDGGEPLAGTVKFAFGTDGKPEIAQVVDPKTEVVLTAPGGGTFEAGKYYYVTLLPGTVAGLWLTFNTASEEGVLYINSSRTIKRSVFGVLKNVDTNVTQWETAAAVTIKDFAQELVTILDVWESTTGTIDMLKGEDYEGGEWKVENAHYVPDATTITVGGKTYNTADMFETAIRSYLLVRGYNGLETEKYGKGSIPALDGGALAMSTTPVPETHSYYWGASPYNETNGNGGHFVMGTKDENEHCKIMLDALDNWAMRSLNFQHGQAITNLCGYAGGQLAGYYGCFCSKRALLTYTFFFKYLLDNNLDKADAIDASTIFRTELFGDENTQSEPVKLKAQWLFSEAAALDETTGYAQTWGGANKYKDTGEWDGTEGYAYYTAGDGGRYINAKYGNGRLTYIQEDKSGMTNNSRAARVVGATGHPYVTGLWYGDYWLFEVPSDVELPAGTKVHVKYIARSSTSGAKYWMGEYYDAGEWKIAPMEVIEEAYNFATPVETTLTDRDGQPETFSYNIKMKENGSSNTTVETYFTLTAPTSKIQYRQRVTGLYRASNGTTSITGLGTATTRIAGSDALKDDGTYSSPLIEVVE